MLFGKLLSAAILFAAGSSAAPTSTSTKASSSTHAASTTAVPTPTATFIVPLYIYPTPGAWTPLFNSLAANPRLKHQVVINPANGPGNANTYPDSNYITAISTLHQYPNAILLCYVHTSYATRSISAIETDITTCANWKNYTGADIHMSGIFFDEAVATYNSSTSSFMSTITSFARKSIPSSTIVYNPGEVVVAAWYSLADYIIAFENTYSAYTSQVIGWIPAGYQKKSLFVMYGFTGTVSDQTNLVNAIVHTGGVGGLFVTNQTVYSAWSGLWSQFTSAMNSA